jgi:hypothetical protein
MMLGMSESDLKRAIDHGAFGISPIMLNIPDQESLQPNDILKKLANGVVEAIAKNNEKIEANLRSRGVL